MHRLVGVGGERAAGRRDVRRLRVVDVADAVALADELEPVRHAGERAQRLGDRLVADAGRARGGRGRGSRVLAVVRPADRGSAGSSSSAANSTTSPVVAVARRPARHDRRARALEDAQLRGAVGVERAVAVEVVRLEVEQHGDVAGELVHVLELEARELADDPVRARARDESGVPTLPATATSRPAARKIAPSSSVVVVLPFVPVTPTNRASASSR